MGVFTALFKGSEIKSAPVIPQVDGLFEWRRGVLAQQKILRDVYKVLMSKQVRQQFEKLDGGDQLYLDMVAPLSHIVTANDERMVSAQIDHDIQNLVRAVGLLRSRLDAFDNDYRVRFGHMINTVASAASDLATLIESRPRKAA
ncbi:MAG: hypothetical protein ABIH41_05000 [Nanoarchaeota archaeon]